MVQRAIALTACGIAMACASTASMARVDVGVYLGAPVYAAPPPVIYQPPPVVYAPRPVYGPAYYGPPRWHDHGRHRGWHGHGHGHGRRW